MEFVDWVFARELLVEGLIRPVGEGDVRIRPSEAEPGLALFHLESPFGQVDFSACCRWLNRFLECTARLVPVGEELEWLEIDASITRLLTGKS
jgi:hypothetical protein